MFEIFTCENLKKCAIFLFLYFVLSVAWIWDQPLFDGDSRTVFWHSQMISSHVKLIEIDCAWV